MPSSLADTIARIEGRGVELPEVAREVALYVELDPVASELLTALDEATAENTKLKATLAEMNAIWNSNQEQLDEAMAEVERLKCCGNCEWFTNVEYEMCECPNEQSVDPEYVSAYDSCRFAPSRWAKRGGA